MFKKISGVFIVLASGGVMALAILLVRDANENGWFLIITAIIMFVTGIAVYKRGFREAFLAVGSGIMGPR